MTKDKPPSNVDMSLLAPMFEEFLKDRQNNDTDSSGGGSSGGSKSSSDWKQSVETRLTQIHDDLRLGAKGIGCIMLAIIGMYVWTGYKADNINSSMSKISESVAILENETKNLLVMSTSISSDIEKLDEKIDHLILNSQQKIIEKED